MGARGHRLFAAVYDGMTSSMERAWLGHRRERLLGDITGDVLELGAGTGANLPYLRAAGRVVTAEPDPAMARRLRGKLASVPMPVELSGAAAESLPYPDGSFDAVVSTLVLCTVTDPHRALAEARRVLKPGGRLLVIEHVRGHGALAQWQDRITPLWSRLMAGCHPNRDLQAAIETAGFRFDHLEVFDPMPRLVPTRPVLQAVASRVHERGLQPAASATLGR